MDRRWSKRLLKQPGALVRCNGLLNISPDLSTASGSERVETAPCGPRRYHQETQAATQSPSHPIRTEAE